MNPRKLPDAADRGVCSDAWLCGKRRYYLIDNGIRFGTHFRVGGILNGMVHKHPLRAIHTQRCGLGGCSINKFSAGNRNCRGALNFEPYRVMQTARGTGASVG